MAEYDVDVAILGGGLVGASMALALSQTSLSSVLFEAIAHNANAQPSFDDKVVALAKSSQNFLNRLGIWREIVSEATPIQHIHVSDRGHAGIVRLHASDYHSKAFGFVANTRKIGGVLYGALAKQTQCAVNIPSQIIDCKNIVNGVEILVEDEKGQRKTWRARLAIVAMGAKPDWLQSLNFTITSKSYHQTALVANVACQKSHQNWAYERFTESGPLALLPITQQSMSMVLTVTDDEKEKWLGKSPAELLQGIQARFGYRLGRFEKLGELQDYPLTLRYTQSLFCGRALLIGNASHGLHPIAGQGFNLGLRDVETLLKTLSSSTTAEEIGTLTQLMDYESQRESDHKRIITATDSLAECFQKRPLPVQLLRSAACHTLNLAPIFRQPLVSVAMGYAPFQSMYAHY
ncbi:MAG: 2-octaprenyl-6-methoxyphenyl hydroxylase [Pseudomonadota bacterium]